MSFILLLLSIVAVLILFLFSIDARVRLVFDTVRDDIHITVFWLYPFIKATATMENLSPVLDFYLFGLHLFRKNVKSRKNNAKGVDLLKAVHPKNISVNTSYGFRNPSTTGITCGVVSAASQFINIDYIRQNPDFMALSDYIYLDATASVNLGTSLTNLIKHSKKRRNLQWIRAQT